MSFVTGSVLLLCVKSCSKTVINKKLHLCGGFRCSVDLSNPVKFSYLPIKQWVVQFEKCCLSNYVLLMCTPTTNLNLPLQLCTYSNYMLYSRKPTINIFFYLLDCVLLTSKPTPTLNLPLQYSNADTLNIVVQREKK